MMYDYGEFGAGYMVLKGILGVLFFAAASFVFSLVFWLTKNMVEGKKKR